MAKRVLDNLALFSLIVLVALRPVIAETYDSAGSSLTPALETVADPTPLRTLVIDVVILIAALIAVITHGHRILSGMRRTGLGSGFLVLIVAGVVSCLAAGNKRLAINAAVDWLCLPILVLALVLLLSTSWRRTLLLAAILGAGGMQVLECLEQRATFDETVAEYEQNKQDFWQRQGVAPDAPRVALFEARMRARECSGYLPHSSVAGSYLTLVAFCAIGLCISRLRGGDGGGGSGVVVGRLLALVMATAPLPVLPLTGSRGAMLATTAGVVLWIITSLLRRTVNVHRRTVFIVAWAMFFLIVVGAIAYGIRHQSLPGTALTFRWQYWTASARMIADHPWTGVGRENFGRHYLQYKSIESPEEVANPHNLFVQAAAEWGLPGWAGLTWLLIGGSHVLVCRRRKMQESGLTNGSTAPGGDAARPSTAVTDQPISPGLRGAAFLALTLAVALLRVPLFGTDDPHYIFYKFVTGMLAWLIGAGAVIGLSGVGGETVMRRERTIATATAWGLFAFLVHDLINFALFVPATATTAAALFAWALSVRHDTLEHATSTDDDSSKHRTRPTLKEEALLILLAVGTMAVLWFGTIPVARCMSALDGARALAHTVPVQSPVEKHPALRSFERAASSDHLDPTPLLEAGRWLAGVAEADPAIRLQATDLAIGAMQRAAARDPFNTAPHRGLSLLYLSRARMTRDRTDFEDAVAAARTVLRLYPENPRGLVSLADILAQAGETLHDRALLTEAVETWRAALELDDRRPEWEIFRRFSPKTRADIEQKIAAARAALGEQ